LVKQIPDMEAIIVPVGGGGLISGIGFAIKSLNPKCKVYGVQAKGADSMCQALEKGERCELFKVSTFSDGIAVKMPGKLTYELCSKYVDEMVYVSDDETAAAILALIEQQKLIAEGAGAVSVAAAMFKKLPLQNKKVCAIVSGGNIDVNILSRVIHRGLMTSGRLSDVTLELLDKPGQLKEVSAIIADMGANVTRVLHNPAGEDADINGCHLMITMETRDHDHLLEINDALKAAGFKLVDKK